MSSPSDTSSDKDVRIPSPSHTRSLAEPRLPTSVLEKGVDSEWATNGVPVSVPSYPDMRTGDRIRLFWGDRLIEHSIQSTQVDQTVTVFVDQNTIETVGDQDALRVVYQVVDVTGSDSRGWSPDTYVTVDAFGTLLSAPFLEEASEDNSVDLEWLGEDDAMLSIFANRKDFVVGDSIWVSWVGYDAGARAIEHRAMEKVTALDRAVLFTIPNAWIRASAGSQAVVSYSLISHDESERRSYRLFLKVGVARTPATLAPPPIPETVHHAKPPAPPRPERPMISRQLLVMGARGERFSYGDKSTSRLIALDKSNRRPVPATWRYEGDCTSVNQATFRDTQPWRRLWISLDNDLVMLMPQNISAGGESGTIAAISDRGDIAAWGQQDTGGAVPTSVQALTSIREVHTCALALAALSIDGTIACWGDTHNGVLYAPSTITKLDDVVSLIGSKWAFSALRANGQVTAWGAPQEGGAVPDSIARLTDVLLVCANHHAFAALRATGQVVAWGSDTKGGKIPPPILELTDISQVIAGTTAFAALRANGQVVAWGDANNGGQVPQNVVNIRDIVAVTGNGNAFVARRASGQIVAWGHPKYGGYLPADIIPMNNIVSITGNQTAFAALKNDGHVVTWGEARDGGRLPPNTALRDVVQITSSAFAFAALHSNGTVTTWGRPFFGGDCSAVIRQLTDVRAIYGNRYAFTALTADGRVVTWGNRDSGGDSSAVHNRLTGRVSYEAQAEELRKARLRMLRRTALTGTAS